MGNGWAGSFMRVPWDETFIEMLDRSSAFNRAWENASVDYTHKQIKNTGRRRWHSIPFLSLMNGLFFSVIRIRRPLSTRRHRHRWNILLFQLINEHFFLYLALCVSQFCFQLDARTINCQSNGFGIFWERKRERERERKTNFVGWRMMTFHAGSKSFREPFFSEDDKRSLILYMHIIRSVRPLSSIDPLRKHLLNITHTHSPDRFALTFQNSWPSDFFRCFVFFVSFFFSSFQTSSWTTLHF